MTIKRHGALSLVRPHLLDLVRYEAVEPPEVLAAQAGIPETEIVKLNANENPYGPSSKVGEALARMDRVHIYPDPYQTTMREAIGRHVELDANHVVVGNGSDEIIDLLFRAVLDPGDSIVDSEPTFGMYPFVAHVCGGHTAKVDRGSMFEVNVDAVLAARKEHSAKAIVLASPNNPTGNTTPLSDVKRLLEAGCLVVIDEAYHEFGGSSASALIPSYQNLAVLRTMSKWAGLAGLRVGYGLMAPELADLLLRAKPPYNVSQAAEVALLASLDDAETLTERASLIVQNRKRMSVGLTEIPGVTVWPSDANFLLAEMPKGKGKTIYDALARKGVFVRYFRHGRLADFLRISVGTSEETDRLLQAMSEAVAPNE